MKTPFYNPDFRYELINHPERNKASTEEIAAFVHEGISTHRFLEDALDTAIAYGVFSESLVPELEQILRSRVSYYIKLSVLDLLQANKSRIGSELFIALVMPSVSSANLLLRFQAAVYLSVYDANCFALTTSIVEYVVPAQVYRLLQSLENDVALRTLYAKHQNMMLAAATKVAASAEQKAELVEWIRRLY